MNRRDVIIIAVLVNAGLLVVLFASALKSGKDQPEISVQREPIVNTPPVVHNNVLPPRGDEVDQVLSQFATVNSTQNQASTMAAPVLQPFPTSTSPMTADAPPALPGFSNDIQGFPPAQTLSITPPAFSPPLAEDKIEESYKEVKVKKGDALEKIARTHNTTVQEIMRINHLTSTQLKIGQVLKIGTKSSKNAKGPVTKEQPASGEAKYYTVKNGDNPWTIAVKNHMKVDELLKLNGLDEEKARKLKAGDQLRIR